MEENSLSYIYEYVHIAAPFCSLLLFYGLLMSVKMGQSPNIAKYLHISFGMFPFLFCWGGFSIDLGLDVFLYALFCYMLQFVLFLYGGFSLSTGILKDKTGIIITIYAAGTIYAVLLTEMALISLNSDF